MLATLLRPRTPRYYFLPKAAFVLQGFGITLGAWDGYRYLNEMLRKKKCEKVKSTRDTFYIKNVQ
jgi:hypothetical protein